MICLCCGKEINKKAQVKEYQHQWHIRCTKIFFGMNDMPELEINKEQLEQLAISTVHKGLTVPGVQKKLSLHLSKDNDNSRLTIVDYPTGYILKPQTEDFAYLPEFEYLAMQLAEIAGIKVVPYALLNTIDGKAYITKRIDRELNKGKVSLYAMEDFCQLSRRLTQDKYRGSYEQCSSIIKRYSATSKLDLVEMFIRIVLSFIIGNSDMHLKNLSLIEDAPGSRVFHLSAAYDILPVNIVMPEDTEELALPANGKKQKLRKKDFILLAEKCEITSKTAEKIIKSLCAKENKYIDAVNNSYLDDANKEKMIALIKKRINVLS